MNRSILCGNCVFSQNFHTTLLGEPFVFAQWKFSSVAAIHRCSKEQLPLKILNSARKTLTITLIRIFFSSNDLFQKVSRELLLLLWINKIQSSFFYHGLINSYIITESNGFTLCTTFILYFFLFVLNSYFFGPES